MYAKVLAAYKNQIILNIIYIIVFVHTKYEQWFYE